MVGQVFTRPEYQWVERRRLVSWLARQWHNLVEWLNHLADRYPVGFNIGLALVVVALIVLLVHVAYVMWRIVRPAARTGTRKTAAGAGIIMDAAAHLARADALARAGRYAEALAHRFLAVVLELDRLKALRFHVSKTPAEYVGEARLTDAGRASLAGLVTQLYRHLFGAVPCDAGEYESFGAAAQELARGRHVVPA
ncbi:MAG TPA: DUF4129 domain-containing protein [Gemmatimonadales bacterium]|nr:DUF4129 domain-containing protein [Gemmatimonadales bacterium]